MVEIYKPESDALSRLVQLHAGRNEIRLAWTGNGVRDLAEVMHAHAIHARMSKHLWTGLRALMAMPEMKELPEPLQAQMASIVLNAQVLRDLDSDEHARRLAASEKPKGAA